MKSKAFVVTPQDHQSPLNVLGVKVTVLASNEATKAYEITHQSGDEGIGPPPHSHPWDESFYVLKGRVEFTVAGKTTACPPGTLVHVPASTVHCFHFAAHGTEMLEVTGQGGTAVKMFAAVDGEIPQGPPDIPRVVEVLRQNGVTVAP